MNGFLIFLFLFIFAIIGILVLILTTLYKSIQFTLTATNLYKKMIVRQDLMVKLLIDIRDNTKVATEEDLEKMDQITMGYNLNNNIYCPNCKKSDGYRDSNGDKFCPNCKEIFL